MWNCDCGHLELVDLSTISFAHFRLIPSPFHVATSAQTDYTGFLGAGKLSFAEEGRCGIAGRIVKMGKMIPGHFEGKRIPNPMRELYSRLAKVGFDQVWLRSTVLPDWWEDELATVPFNRASAEAAIAGFLGFPIRVLRDTGAALARPSVAGVCFKRNGNKPVEELAAALQVARQVTKIAVAATSLPAFTGGQSAKAVRDAILSKNSTVTLDGLVEYCWSAGIPVLGVTALPKKAKRFDGVAMFERDRPAVVLSSNRDGPAWLAFHLAHELGHQMLGHVGPGEWAVLDADLKDKVKDDAELEADEFALEVLTGSPEGIHFKRGAHKAHEVGPLAVNFAAAKAHDIDPGVIVLSYCKSTSYWGIAQGALDAIGGATGGHEALATALAKHVDFDNLSEPEARFLSATCQLPAGILVS